MSFYKRSIHSFLGQTNTKTMTFHDDEILGSMEARDLRGIRIAEANGLTLCTEYLGFESYDMKMSENEVKMCHAEEETERAEKKKRKTTEKNVVPAREEKRDFPPPLSSLNGRGQRSFYFRPVRKDGRLELTQVMIDRPEIFHASRENGRLKLHLVTGTTRKDDNSQGKLRGQKCMDNPIKAYCDSEEAIDLKDEPRDNTATSDQLVDLSMIKDDSGTGSLGYKSNEHSDEHGARKWRYKNCYKSRNHDEYDYHHHHHNHHHHHIHPYHHCNSNNNMHLWSQSYVKTR